MKRLVLAILLSTLGTAATITFPQSANAGYRDDHYSSHHDWEDRSHYEHRGDRRYYEHRGDYYGYHPHSYYREYYPHGYYDRGYYSYPRSHVQLVIPLIFR